MNRDKKTFKDDIAAAERSVLIVSVLGIVSTIGYVVCVLSRM